MELKQEDIDEKKMRCVLLCETKKHETFVPQGKLKHQVNVYDYVSVF